MKDHTRTETALRDQAVVLKGHADQQYSDLEKLQDSRERKR